MQSIVIRLYQMNSLGRTMTGTAQIVSDDEVFSFSSMDDLWMFLYQKFTEEEVPKVKVDDMKT